MKLSWGKPDIINKFYEELKTLTPLLMLLSRRRLQQDSEITFYSTAVTIHTTAYKIRQILHFAHTIRLCVPYASVNSDYP